MACRVFICYRRADTAAIAAALHDRLAIEFGSSNVFIDRTMQIGAQFPAEIAAFIRSSDVLVALIGKDWLRAPDASGRRPIDRSDDWVRREILDAWHAGKRVMPVLVAGATMPSKHDLPRALARLAESQAIELTSSSWGHDVGELIWQIRQHVRGTARGEFAGIDQIRTTAPTPALVRNACLKPLNVLPPAVALVLGWALDAWWLWPMAAVFYVACAAITFFDLKQAKQVDRKRAARRLPA